MRLLRSITRRGFDIGTAGWFTVLKPNTWFPASRLPGRFRYHGNPSAESTGANQAISVRILLSECSGVGALLRDTLMIRPLTHEV